MQLHLIKGYDFIGLKNFETESIILKIELKLKQESPIFCHKLSVQIYDKILDLVLNLTFVPCISSQKCLAASLSEKETFGSFQLL